MSDAPKPYTKEEVVDFFRDRYSADDVVTRLVATIDAERSARVRAEGELAALRPVVGRCQELSREHRDEMSRVKADLDAARGLLRKLADASEEAASADPDMPSAAGSAAAFDVALDEARAYLARIDAIDPAADVMRPDSPDHGTCATCGANMRPATFSWGDCHSCGNGQCPDFVMPDQWLDDDATAPATAPAEGERWGVWCVEANDWDWTWDPERTGRLKAQAEIGAIRCIHGSVNGWRYEARPIPPGTPTEQWRMWNRPIPRTGGE